MDKEKFIRKLLMTAMITIPAFIVFADNLTKMVIGVLGILAVVLAGILITKDRSKKESDND